MTLEDFFTLTEMKNGLATLGRVEELISMLKKHKDCVLTNLGDTARQWSTVASTLAATENKDCLNHFVQLNGLCFLNQWLQEAVKHSNDLTDSAVEELINALLGSLERLPIGREKFNASGIQITVEQLLGYKSLNINERARILFERWDHAKVSADSYQDLEKGGTCKDDKPKPHADANMVDGVQSMHPVLDISPSKGTEEGDCGVESAGTESHHSNVTRGTDSSQLDTDNDVKTSTSNQIIPDSSSNLTAANLNNLGNMNSSTSSLVSNSCQENFCITEEISICPAVLMASAGAYCSLNTSGRDDDQCDASVFKDVDAVNVLKMEVNTKEGRPCNSGKNENFDVSSSFGISAYSPARKPECTVSCNFDSKESRSCISGTIEPRPRSASVDCMVPNLKTVELNPVMEDLLSNGRKLRKIDGHRKEAVGSASELEELRSESNLKVCKVLETVMPHDSSETLEIKLTGEIGQRSEVGLEDGEIDALEVARQVAIEVEREVVDYREPFCSSSPEVSSGEIVGARSHDIVEEDKQGQQLNRDIQDQPVKEELNGNGSLTGSDLSDGASSPKGENSRISETEICPEKCDQDLGSQKPTTVDEESYGKSDRKKCEFDLNEDVCTEEFDWSMNPIPNNSVSVSAPIAAVAASKGVMLLPVTPLRFEGELGWKGSAATSAFRPASPRRTPDGEKTYSGSKQKANFIQFDLNVAESADDVVFDPTSTKQVPVSSGFPSRDSSMEVSSRRAERLNLDLNRLGDEDVSLHPSSYWRHPNQNGDQTLSPASSSSSRQPSMRNFDLNDKPCFFDVCGSHNLNKSSSKASGMYGSSKLDDPVITLMGSRLAVERKDNANHAQQSFLGSGPGMESNMAARPMLSYAHIPRPAYWYNGLGAGPSMPFPPALFGPGSIPYMVDSRGSAVIPHILGSAGLHTASSATPPFLMSATNAPTGLNGDRPSQSGLDLNSGTVLIESGSREAGSLKHLFKQGQSGIMVEQAKTASQNAATSAVPLKRKEPDSAWEPYAFDYKHVTSWQ